MSETLATSPVIRAIGWALLQSVWQGALIGLITAVALAVLRRSPPGRRYVVACAGLLAMALAFAATALGSARELAAVGPASLIAAPPAVSFEPDETTAPANASASLGEKLAPSALLTWRARLQSWSPVFVPLWLAGGALLSLRFLASWMLVERIRRAAARPLPHSWLLRIEAIHRHLDLSRPVAVLESARVHVPTVIGWLRPVVLLPVSALSGLTVAQLEAIVAHELAHVRRHDYAINVLQSAIEILLFYHPVTWWISQRIRTEREHCCDDIAVAYCGNRVLYAGALADLEAARDGQLTLALAATNGPLLGRVRRLLSARPSRPSSSAAGLAAAALVVMTTGFLGVEVRGVFRSTIEAQSATPGAGRTIPDDQGVVQGQVIDRQTGQPVPGARVEVFRDSRSGAPFERLLTVKTATTDAEGRFELEGVAPGEYLLVANAAGYVETTYGDLTRTAESGVSVRVSGGRTTSGVEFRLQPSASVSGRIFADNGEGLPGVEVEVLREMRLSGIDGPGAVGFAQTEEGGAFRVRGLQPGEYMVRAYVADSIRPTRGGTSSAYAATFYPEATRADDAQRLRVQAGQEIVGIDFTLATARMHIVSGKLIDSGGATVAAVRVLLRAMNAAGPDAENDGVTVGADGRYVFRDVAPGKYMLIVNDRASYRRWLSSMRIVEVMEEDLTGLDIYAETPTHMEARIVRDGGGQLPFDPAKISINIQQRTQGSSFMTGIGPAGRIQSDGTFSIDASSGTAWFQVTELPTQWIVKSIALDGADITDQPVEIGAGARRKLEITLTDRVSGLTGTVTDRRNRAAVAATVLIFPEDRAKWGSQRLIKQAQVRFQGRFRIDDLPAGSYRVVGADSLPGMVMPNAELLDRLWQLSTPVRLDEGEQRTLALKLAATAGVID